MLTWSRRHRWSPRHNTGRHISWKMTRRHWKIARRTKFIASLRAAKRLIIPEALRLLIVSTTSNRWRSIINVSACMIAQSASAKRMGKKFKHSVRTSFSFCALSAWLIRKIGTKSTKSLIYRTQPPSKIRSWLKNQAKRASWSSRSMDRYSILNL